MFSSVSLIFHQNFALVFPEVEILLPEVEKTQVLLSFCTKTFDQRSRMWFTGSNTHSLVRAAMEEAVMEEAAVAVTGQTQG